MARNTQQSQESSAAVADVPVSKYEPGVVIDMPLKRPSGYQTNHLDVQLSGTEPEKLAWLFAGLQAQNATLSNGLRLDSAAKVIRYLLQQVELPK